MVEFFEIELRVKGEETIALPCAAEPQEFPAGAIEDDPDVEEFFAVDAGNDADDGIFKQVRFLQGGPPLQRSRMGRHGLSGIGYRWLAKVLGTVSMRIPTAILRE